MRSKIFRLLPLYISIVLVVLWLTENLILYIHPRYVVFTVAMAILCAILFGFYLMTYTKETEQPTRSSFVLMIVVIFMTLVPPASLTSTLAPKRLETGSTREQTVQVSSFDMFSQDLSRFELQDWAAYLSEPLTSSQIVGKEAAITGFLLVDTDGQHLLARYRLTCCAVDASPLVVPIRLPQNTTVEQGQWLTVSGTFITVDSPSYPYQLEASTYQEIEEPEQPYVY